MDVIDVFRIYILDEGRLYWLRQWINDGTMDHLVFTTEGSEAFGFLDRQEAEDYRMQMVVLGYDVYINGGRYGTARRRKT